MSKITKEQFEAVYNQHLPNRWIKFAYKHNNITFIILGLFFLGFLGTLFNINKTIIEIASICYLISLSVLVLFLSCVVVMNNLRIRKIIKKLGISKTEYNSLVNNFMNN